MRVFNTRMREVKFIYIERVRHTRGSLLFEGVCLKEIYCYGILIEEEEKHIYKSKVLHVILSVYTFPFV